MSQGPPDLQSQLDVLAKAGPEGVVPAVDLILSEADWCGASDIHFQPSAWALEVRFRIDGVLRPAVTLPHDLAPNVVGRLKVMAELLTYRRDVPQEGSIRATGATAVDRRVSTFPTVHGENAVVRVFNPSAGHLSLGQLGLPTAVLSTLEGLLQERSGAVFLTGPSGSGKTTTIYACLRRLATDGDGRHIVTIEDPVERVLEGVSQSHARPGTEFDFARGLRSLLRQDPEVIMVGEVRDRETAAVAIEAALTGHLLFSTLHAGSACGVIGRLLEMGVEPYLLTGGVRGILNQRLLRRLCDACKQPEGDAWRAGGCGKCGGTGYQGRLLVAELLTPDAEFRRAVLRKADADELELVARQCGWVTIRDTAATAVAAGQTTSTEVDRVLGPPTGTRSTTPAKP
ncbi:GspE/PulE family protein [Fimbriiglobus ruber]|uniref:Twitching motility protein PilT n=1 Tax=Fimbriiglobus ruber TaxID=1908690 RepID=A0A225ECD9_9BACT|nr:GspE/PulE family protein [Fimbriiglobus ruber]OWK46999.1 Twitching motility protein PilT [Fimbriiglobus ruber]